MAILSPRRGLQRSGFVQSDAAVHYRHWDEAKSQVDHDVEHGTILPANADGPVMLLREPWFSGVASPELSPL